MNWQDKAIKASRTNIVRCGKNNYLDAAGTRKMEENERYILRWNDGRLVGWWFLVSFEDAD